MDRAVNKELELLGVIMVIVLRILLLRSCLADQQLLKGDNCKEVSHTEAYLGIRRGVGRKSIDTELVTVFGWDHGYARRAMGYCKPWAIASHGLAESVGRLTCKSWKVGSCGLRDV